MIATAIDTQTVVSPATFAAAVTIVAPYAADDLSRPILSGINLRTHGNTLTLSATDGFAVAEYAIPCDVQGAIDITISAKEFVAAVKATAKAPSQLTITQDGSTLTLLTCDGEQTLTAVEAKYAVTYPDVGRIIRRESPVNIIIACADLRPAVLSLDGFARHQSEIIKLSHADGKITFSAHSTDADIAVSVEADASSSVKRCPALKYLYLARIARITVKGNVVLGIGEPSHMVTVQWSDIPGLTVGVMPMVIGN